MVETTAAVKNKSTGISIDLFMVNENLLLFLNLSSVRITILKIIKNEPVMINALIFTRSTGFSKYIITARGTDTTRSTKK